MILARLMSRITRKLDTCLLLCNVLLTMWVIIVTIYVKIECSGNKQISSTKTSWPLCGAFAAGTVSFDTNKSIFSKATPSPQKPKTGIRRNTQTETWHVSALGRRVQSFKALKHAFLTTAVCRKHRQVLLPCDLYPKKAAAIFGATHRVPLDARSDRPPKTTSRCSLQTLRTEIRS